MLHLIHPSDFGQLGSDPLARPFYGHMQQAIHGIKYTLSPTEYPLLFCSFQLPTSMIPRCLHRDPRTCCVCLDPDIHHFQIRFRSHLRLPSSSQIILLFGPCNRKRIKKNWKVALRSGGTTTMRAGQKHQFFDRDPKVSNPLTKPSRFFLVPLLVNGQG